MLFFYLLQYLSQSLQLFSFGLVSVHTVYRRAGGREILCVKGKTLPGRQQTAKRFCLPFLKVQLSAYPGVLLLTFWLNQECVGFLVYLKIKRKCQGFQQQLFIFHRRPPDSFFCCQTAVADLHVISIDVFYVHGDLFQCYIFQLPSFLFPYSI